MFTRTHAHMHSRWKYTPYGVRMGTKAPEEQMSMQILSIDNIHHPSYFWIFRPFSAAKCYVILTNSNSPQIVTKCYVELDSFYPLGMISKWKPEL